MWKIYVGWGILNSFMLSSLPCFYAFCWSAISTSLNGRLLMAITKVRHDLSALAILIFFTAIQLMTWDNSHSAHFHASSSLCTRTDILNFPVNHILQVSCDWVLCCDWYTLHGAGQLTNGSMAMSQTPSLSVE